MTRETRIEGRARASLADLLDQNTYGWAPARPGEAAYDRLGIRWYVLVGEHDGGVGSIGRHHTVTEHDDGTITVEPSLVMPRGWHGYLRRGVFSRVADGFAMGAEHGG